MKELKKEEEGSIYKCHKISFYIVLIWARTLSRYFLIQANPLFLAISGLMGSFISILEQTFTSIPPSTSTILVAVRINSPLTLSFSAQRPKSLTHMLQCQLSFLKEYFTQQKSLPDIIKILLQHRYNNLVSPPTTQCYFLYISMLLSNFVCKSKSLDMDQQVSAVVGKVNEQVNMFTLSSWQQFRFRGQEVQGFAWSAFGGTQNILPKIYNLLWKRLQKGCQGLITSLQSLIFCYFSTWSTFCSYQPILLYSLLTYLYVALVPSTSSSLSVLFYPRQSDILSCKVSSLLTTIPPACQSQFWLVIKVLCSSLISANLRVYFLMRHEQRQRMALSQVLYIVIMLIYFNKLKVKYQKQLCLDVLI